MDNENGSERDHDTAQQQQTGHTSVGASTPTGPPPGQSVVPPATTTVPPSAATPAPAPYSAPSAPSAPTAPTAPTVPPIVVPVRGVASPTSPQSPIPPQVALPPRPSTAPHNVPWQSVPRAEFEDNNNGQFNPDTARSGNGRDHHLGNPLPPLPIDLPTTADLRVPPKSKTIDSHQGGGRPRSEVDWIVPVEEKSLPRRTVGERLEPTVAKAIVERDKYALKAKMTGYALNAAIGLQVLLGSLTTGLSAAATTGRQAAVATTVLGGLATLVAGYLARARGSNEPELSISRVKDLEQFIRECQAFQLDYGHDGSMVHDEYLFRLRARFEELLGNASGERKLATPV